MSAPSGWLERLLDWAVGTARDPHVRHARADAMARLVPVHGPPTEACTPHAQRDREREMELRVLMSTWM